MHLLWSMEKTQRNPSLFIKNYSLHFSQIFVNMILGYLSFLLSHTKSLIILMHLPLLKYVLFFLISLRHLIGFGMKVCCSNSNLQDTLLIKIFLSDRFKKVVLSDHYSTCENVLAGVPQGSILGPLFFLIFINDFYVKIFTDDILFSTITLLYSYLQVNIYKAFIRPNLD